MLLKNGSSGTQVKFLQYGLHILCCAPFLLVYPLLKYFDTVNGRNYYKDTANK